MSAFAVLARKIAPKLFKTAAKSGGSSDVTLLRTHKTLVVVDNSPQGIVP